MRQFTPTFLKNDFPQLCGVCVGVFESQRLSKGLQVLGKLGEFFRLRGRIFQRWVRSLWTFFVAESFPWNFRSFGHDKKPSIKFTTASVPHPGRVSGAGLSQCHSRVRLWDTPALHRTACTKNCQQWEVLSLDGLCPLSLQADGSRCKGNACSKQNCNNIVFFCGSLQLCLFKSRVHAGDSRWKVRGPKHFIKFLHHGTQLQPNTNFCDFPRFREFSDL